MGGRVCGLPTRMPIPVAIVDDDPIFAEGIREWMDRSGSFACVAVCHGASEALEVLPSVRPRIVLMDIQMPGKTGPLCVAELAPRMVGVDFLMLTVFEEYDLVYESLVAGATGYLLKRAAPSELLGAMQELMEGGSPMSGAIARKVVLALRRMPPADGVSDPLLSQREEEILNALARGRRPKEIAHDFGLSFHTIRTHQQNIYKKLQVRSRREAVSKYRGTGAAAR